MPTINDSQLQALNRSFRNAQADALKDLTTYYQDISTEVKSTGPSETYVDLFDFSTMREWLGERTIANFGAADWTIKNKPWEATLGVKASDIEDDKMGLYRARLAAFWQRKPLHIDELMIQLLIAGLDTGKSYDGKAFFATTHASGSNKGTVALSSTNFEAAVTAMMQQKGEDGKPLRVHPTHLIVGPTKWSAGRAIIEVSRLDSGADNPNYQFCKLVTVPLITTNAWFLIDASKPMRPLIYQFRSETEPRWIEKPGEKKNEGMYGFDARYNGGYGLHQLAYGSTGG